MNRPKLKPAPKAAPPATDAEFEETVTEKLPASPAKGILEETKPLVVQLQESEFQAQLAFAQRNPRSINRAMEAMVKMATLTEEAAATMSYAVPRGGKMIEGPSIRFAEIVKQAWPHSDSDAFVVHINREDKFVVVRGWYYDFEMDNRSRSTVQRSIKDKNGKIYSDDMINVTCNAACAIAKRNAILEGIPRAVWMNAWEAARRTAAGGLEGLPKKRQEVLKHFMRAGVAPDRVIATLGVQNEAKLNSEHITTLRGMWSALQNGEATLDELFPPIKAPVPVETHDDPGARPKRRTLADLGDDEPKETLQDGSGLAQEAIDKARDDGRRGFHKGLEKPPKAYQSDEELTAAWNDGFESAARDHNEAIDGDSEDTKGAG